MFFNGKTFVFVFRLSKTIYKFIFICYRLSNIKNCWLSV